jgi:uncharacterized protein YjgD (DUF1641 family)
MTTLTTSSVDEKLDLLMAQVAAMSDELARERAARAQWADLVAELSPVASGAMAVATRELEGLSDDLTGDDLARFARTLARSLPTIERLLAQLDGVSELAATVTPLGSQAMAVLTSTLQTADEKGYGAFARGGAAIADRVVTSFSEDDVAALGDNVVLILDTVRQMTQPEIMTMLRRTMATAQEAEDQHGEPPSTFALLKSMRDPQTRRGLAKLMSMLHTMGEEPTSTTNAALPARTTPPE